MSSPCCCSSCEAPCRAAQVRSASERPKRVRPTPELWRDHLLGGSPTPECACWMVLASACAAGALPKVPLPLGCAARGEVWGAAVGAWSLKGVCGASPAKVASNADDSALEEARRGGGRPSSAPSGTLKRTLRRRSRPDWGESGAS